MKRLVRILYAVAVICCFVISNNTHAQNKRTYISLSTGLLVPGNDLTTGGYTIINYRDPKERTSRLISDILL